MPLLVTEGHDEVFKIYYISAQPTWLLKPISYGRRYVIKKLRKAVLPVAGLGTRFLPATKATAKEMLPVVDKPLIQYAVEEARAAGIEQFCMITGRGKTALVEHFDVAYELER